MPYSDVPTLSPGIESSRVFPLNALILHYVLLLVAKKPLLNTPMLKQSFMKYLCSRNFVLNPLMVKNVLLNQVMPKNLLLKSSLLKERLL